MKELIKVEGLQKHFHTLAGKLMVLKGIDWVFYEGEMIGIMGVSGVGKSTFLHILGTLDKPSSGKVFYNIDSDQIDPFSLSNGELALFRNKNIGFVFQFHYLLPEFSAIENIIMPGLINRKIEIKKIEYEELYDRAERLLDELGLYGRKNHKPGELSGGEQQRVAVARALILEPKIILADEPTGNLDYESGDELFRLLLRKNESYGMSFIIVTHNESLAKKCHKTLHMRDGRLF
jgi:lipoprotein-releasing system ATP-binding protein